MFRVGKKWTLWIAEIAEQFHGPHLQRKLWCLWVFGSIKQGTLSQIVFSTQTLKVYVQEEQTVDGKSYSDHTQKNFDCGRYKLFDDETLNSRKRRQADELLDDDFVFYFSGDSSESVNCGGTIINDR